MVTSDILTIIRLCSAWFMGWVGFHLANLYFVNIPIVWLLSILFTLPMASPLLFFINALFALQIFIINFPYHAGPVELTSYTTM